MPQVYHTDNRGDLAGGNFAYISGAKLTVGPASSRKGHDVVDLFPAGDDTLLYPPGFNHEEVPIYFRGRLTCAGTGGCHGIRNQLMPGPTGELIPRVGMMAVRGAHHANQDGRLLVADTVANSYRFLMGVRGLENPYPQERWQNSSALMHNEYYGAPYRPGDELHCFNCHYGSNQATPYSYIVTPRNSMSGFCISCHSNFHARPQPGLLAFFRHPSDFVLPAKGEYAEYLTYELTAPVARRWVPETTSELVRPGEDLVMCHSCHMAHASPYDGMLRFDSTKMMAGYAGHAERTGCFACHTSKGRRK
jgi:predicted CXXCH cytochrome family protein